MSKAKIKEIISFSSEDPGHPASNLLENATFRKWKCKEPGESEACVIFQLENAVQITGIDVGNECSANVEVLVSRSGDSSKSFQVLLSAAMLMSPLESKELQHRNRVKMFRKDKMDRSVMAEKWDMVKVVCTQPHNKHTQYGLSFITLFKESDVNDNTPKPQIGGFTILAAPEEEDDEPPKMGSLFAKKKEEASQPKGLKDDNDPSKISLSTQLRASPVTASFGSGSKIRDLLAKRKLSADNGNSTSASASPPTTSNSKMAQASSQSTSTSKSSKNQPSSSNSGASSSSPSTTSSSRSRSSASGWGSSSAAVIIPTKPIKKKKKITKPFNKLFEDVTFVISGFENPYRSQMRQKALDMGAKCKPDWSSLCTHLICAFVNTPKFRQVRAAGHGKIVTNDWIEECYRQQRRLPWRRYCTDRNDRGDESEEEIYAEGVDDEEDQYDDRDGDDLEDEDEGTGSVAARGSLGKKRKRTQVVESSSDDEQSGSKGKQKCPTEEELYDEDTDVDEDQYEPSNGPKKQASSTSGSPNKSRHSGTGVFSSTIFYIDPEWSLVRGDQRKEIIQIIRDGGGTISLDLTDSVDFYITHQTDWNEDFSEALSDNPNLSVVLGDWITECDKKGKKISYDPFMILPS